MSILIWILDEIIRITTDIKDNPVDIFKLLNQTNLNLNLRFKRLN